MSYRVSKEHFEFLAEKALQSIPKKFLTEFRNIAIVIEDYPDEETLNLVGVERDQLLGLFVGQTHENQKTFFSNPHPYPDTIYLYQRNIEAICNSENDLFREIRATILHEVGHYFGLTDEDLERR